MSNYIKVFGIFIYLIMSISAKAGYLKPHYEMSDIFFQPEWLNLLHYHNGKSVINADSNFFLSSFGAVNPQAEYEATLNGLFDNTKRDNDSVFCRYPARTRYILQSTHVNIENIPQQKCKAYEEYLQEVPMDNVYVVFAAENNQSPSSMLGHSFLKISGGQGKRLKEHSFSYFAVLDEVSSLKFYFDIITIGLDGMYVLSPYQNKVKEYLYGEKRSLWEFKLNLTTHEKMKLKEHLWELKEKNIRYKFITHNCNTAVISILKTANLNFEINDIKPFITPVEYLQELEKQERIKEIYIEPTEYTLRKIKQYGVKNILSADKSTRVDLRYQIAGNNYSLIKFSPVYQDIHDVNTVYYDELESKIADITLGFDFDSKKAFVQSIDVLKMRSILDYKIDGDYSKYFRFSFENDKGFNKTRLKPTVESGAGYGIYFDKTAVYFLPKIGYRYNQYNNFYISPEVGLIYNMNERTKFMTSYGRCFDNKRNNRGYQGKINMFFGYKITQNYDWYVEYSYYSSTYHRDEISLGLAVKF